MTVKRAPIFTEVSDVNAHIERRGPGRVVLANGCFDPLHVGHVRYLDGAKAHGDFLVVAVNNDDSTRRLKGEGRPVVSGDARAEVIASLRMVDAVLLFGDADVARIIKSLRPAVHAKGTDYTVDTVPELETSERLGVETAITGDPKAHASRDILRQMRSARDEGGRE